MGSEMNTRTGGQDLETRRSDIEKALRKKFKRDLIGRFEKAVVQYELVQEGDRIAVCISGGKDSMLMAKLFQELKRHNKFPFSLVFISMDPGYLPQNRSLIEENAALLGIPVEFCETSIFDAVVFSTLYTRSKNPPAISVPACAADISTASPKSAAATRSRSATTMTM